MLVSAEKNDGGRDMLAAARECIARLAASRVVMVLRGSGDAGAGRT